MKFETLLAAALLFGAASQAQADTGLRAEAHLGWDHPSIHLGVSDGVDAVSETLGEDGLLYGVEVGYDARLNDFDLGVYAGFDGASTRSCLGDASGEACVKAGRNWTIGARAGYFVSDNALVYVKGGYANGSVKLSYRDAVDAASDLDVSDNMDGYQIGAGVQVELGSNVYAKLEYVRTNYNDYDYRDGAVGLTVGVDRDNLVYGMGFRF